LIKTLLDHYRQPQIAVWYLYFFIWSIKANNLEYTCNCNGRKVSVSDLANDVPGLAVTETLQFCQ